MIYKFRIILFSMLVIGCNSNERDQVESEANLHIKVNNDSTLVKLGGNPILKDVKKIVSELQLEEIDKGYDSIMLRIFYPNLLHRYVLEIKKTKIKWQANLIRIKYNYDSKLSEYVIDSSINKEVIPKSGWKIFTEKLFKLEISTLPGSNEIPGYKHGIDGCTFTVEYAISNYYRYFQYWEPELNQKEHWQAQKFVQALDLIEKEFEFKRINCD